MIQKKNGVTYISSAMLDQTGLVRHCFSSRQGGVSEGVYESMNVAHGRGDADEHVKRNVERLADAVGFHAEKMAYLRQIHGNEVAETTVSGFIREADGLMTDQKGIALVTYHADCVPVFMVDPVRRVIAMIHAGWRGTAADICGAALSALSSRYHTKPSELLVWIGPSIGRCCFEVGQDVAEKLYTGSAHTPLVSSKAMAEATPVPKQEKFFADLQQLNKEQLLRGGVQDTHIECADLCTCCRKDLFYSHRRDGAARGSMAGVIELR